ncbi:MAG: hypothetical protein ACREFQ_10625 [Stellaceae bacterium]
MVALEGRESDIAESLSTLGLLPLAERRLALGRPRHAAETMALLAGAVALSARGTAPRAVAHSGR